MDQAASNDSIAGRIEVERQRLNFAKPGFASMLDPVSGGAFFLEAVDWSRLDPKAHELARLDRAGFDVLFIVTGRRA